MRFSVSGMNKPTRKIGMFMKHGFVPLQGPFYFPDWKKFSGAKIAVRSNKSATLV